MIQDDLLAEIRHIQKELKEIKRLIGEKPHPLSAIWKEPQGIEFHCEKCNSQGFPSAMLPGLCTACANVEVKSAMGIA